MVTGVTLRRLNLPSADAGRFQTLPHRVRITIGRSLAVESILSGYPAEHSAEQDDLASGAAVWGPPSPVSAASDLLSPTTATLECIWDILAWSRAASVARDQGHWQIGREIVEEEQSGSGHAEYGVCLIDRIASRLFAEFGQDFIPRSLRGFSGGTHHAKRARNASFWRSSSDSKTACKWE